MYMNSMLVMLFCLLICESENKYLETNTYIVFIVFRIFSMDENILLTKKRKSRTSYVVEKIQWVTQKCI